MYFVFFSILLVSSSSPFTSVDFDYDDTLTYDLEISMNQSGFPFETSDQVFCSPSIFDINQDGNNEIIFGDNAGIFYILNEEDMSIYNSYDMGDEIWGKGYLERHCEYQEMGSQQFHWQNNTPGFIAL